MSDNTGIEWCTTTWNPVTGCSPVSIGCQNCFAKRMASRLRGRYGYPADDPFRVTLHPDKLDEPLRWRKPRRVFVCSMGDVFHKDVPDEFLLRVFESIRASYNQGHVFMLLTKRPARMRDFCGRLRYDIRGRGRFWLTEHLEDPWRSDGYEALPAWGVWLGVSIENQQTADERIPLLLQTPAAVRFVSYEPALGPVNIRGYMIPAKPCQGHRALPERPCLCGDDGYFPTLDQVICGAETGPGARPMHVDWVRSVRDQCQEAAVPFFFKGWGEWAHQSQIEQDHGQDGLNAAASHYKPHAWMDKSGWSYRVGKKLAGRKLDGKMHEEYPSA